MSGGERKFLFTTHIFDQPEIEEVAVDLPPPPPPAPTFSEDDIRAAKASAFEEGRAAGRKEALNSLEEKIAQTGQAIFNSIPALLHGEADRRRVFENETLALCLCIFEAVFPYYMQKEGFHELEGAIFSVLRKMDPEAKITVTVSPDMTGEMEKFLASHKQDSANDLRFTVKGDDRLQPGSCKLSWTDGGAVADPVSLGQDVLKALEDILAATRVPLHDEEVPHTVSTDDKGITS